MAHWNIADPYATGHRTPSFGPRATVAILAVTAAIPAVILVWLTPAPLLLPVLSLALLAAAAGLSLLAYWLGTNRHTTHINLWDMAGACAFVGFAAGMVSQPEHVLDLFGATSTAR